MTDAPWDLPRTKAGVGPASRQPGGERWLRLLVAVALVLAVLPGLLGSGSGASAGGAPGRPDPRSAAQAVVRPGETLWEIAVEHTGGDTDPRVYVERIRELNGLDHGPVPAWTVVLLPAS